MRGIVFDGSQASVRDDIEVRDLRAGEVRVRIEAAGLCHSDEHMVTGDMVPPTEAWGMMGITDLWPMIGGHEGAGVVVEVGPHVSSVAVGDHVVLSFVPACGECYQCQHGQSYLCEKARAQAAAGLLDGTTRLTSNGAPLRTLRPTSARAR